MDRETCEMCSGSGHGPCDNCGDLPDDCCCDDPELTDCDECGGSGQVEIDGDEQ